MEISTVNIKKGDILLVYTNGEVIPTREMDHMRKQLDEIMPGVHVVFTKYQVSVITPNNNNELPY